ncbi:MAG: DCC1-like thiol-disulfide oxidoreductase family protein [Spirochaetota bacterium]
MKQNAETSYFFFDGDCPFCSKMAKRLQKRCLAESVQFLSFRKLDAEELLSIHPELSLESLSGEVQYVQNSVRYPGFFAIRKLSHKLRTYRFFAFLLYLPLIPFLGMLVLHILKQKTGH